MTEPQREWFEKDYYKVLGVSDAATDKEITKAYRKLAKENHPDAHPGREERFKEISTAYAVLSDSDKRKSYDDVRKLGPLGGAFGGSGAGPGGPFQGADFHASDLGDLLGGLFGRGRKGGRGGGQASTGPRRGDDLDAVLDLAFDDAVNGIATSITLVGGATCETCHGSGAAPGTSPVVCSVCGGRGVVDQNQGFFSFSQPCSACAGNGMRIETPCPTCRGTGAVRKNREVKVRIPAGVEDGQRIRLRQRGGPGRNGGPAGDLYVTVRVGAHTMFGRRGKDLTLTVPVTFPEAALGATIDVPTMEGPVSLKIPSGTRNGRTFRVKARGAKTQGGAGDLLVTVDVVVPESLSEAERSALEALRNAQAGSSPRSKLGV